MRMAYNYLDHSFMVYPDDAPIIVIQQMADDLVGEGEHFCEHFDISSWTLDNLETFHHADTSERMTVLDGLRDLDRELESLLR